MRARRSRNQTAQAAQNYQFCKDNAMTLLPRLEFKFSLVSQNQNTR